MNTENRLVTLLAGVIATTTSEPVDILGAKRITLALTRADHGSGSSAFKVQVSVDGTTFADFNGLMQDLTNTNAQTQTRATTISLAANTTVMASMDLSAHNFSAMRVVVTETTDGTHTAKAQIER